MVLVALYVQCCNSQGMYCFSLQKCGFVMFKTHPAWFALRLEIYSTNNAGSKIALGEASALS